MPKQTLDAFVAAKDISRHEENREIARTNRTLRAEVEARDASIASLTKRLALFDMLDTGTLSIPTWLTPTCLKVREAVPTMLLTDIHWDEVTKPEQIDFVNKYDRAIALARVERAFTRVIRVTRDYLSGVTYPGFNLFLGGDLLSGIIHEELRETNEATIIEGILSVVEPLAAGIRLLAAEFKHVNVAAVVGNHGRNTKKPRAKNRVQDNFDWLVYKMLEREFKADKRVAFNVPAAADAHIQVYETKYLLTHGDQFRGGSGISGILAPLLLGTHRKTRRSVAAGKPYDVMVMGHFHQSIWAPSKGLIVGGCVCGYNEYAYQGNLEIEAPQCALWLTTPEHGITVSAPVFVGDRATEGW